MAQPLSLGAAFGMPPKDAVAYFESKGYAITTDWRQMWQEAHSKAFTVANATKLDVLQDIRGAVEKGLKEGKTEAWFIKHLTPKLQEKGWWGKRTETMPDGSTRTIGMGSPSRLSLIYRQNMQAAYNVGRYKQQLEQVDDRPWWQYHAVMDARTRYSHAANDAKIYRYDDPFWSVWYPPNGWRCRCRVSTHSERSLARSGLLPQTSEQVSREIQTIRADTGEVEHRTIQGVRLKDGRELYPTAGFGYNPGAAAFGDDMELARKLSRVEDPRLYTQVVQAMNNAPLRHENFAKDVSALLEKGRAGKASMAVGFIERDIADFARRQGQAPTTILVLPEKQLLHAMRASHKKAGISLTLHEVQRLPQMVARPEMVLWDKEHASIIYVHPLLDTAGEPLYDEARRIIIATEAPAQKKRAKLVGPLDAIVNAYRTPLRNLLDSTHYVRIK